MAEYLYSLSEQRAEYLILHAFKGFGIEYDEAILLLKSKDDNTLTQSDRDKVDRLVAAVDNMIAFAVAEEYQLWKRALDMIGDDDVEEGTEEYEMLEDECEKYNKTYALVENQDVEYAMAMASWWISVGRNDYLMYMTQGDERVRPWHAVLEGFTARRDDFPSWMIPPIEWGCRCYLVDMSGESVQNNADLHSVMAKKDDKPSQINEIFSESVCKCGRIFGEAHPYFSIDQKHEEMLNGFVERLTEKWYG